MEILQALEVFGRIVRNIDMIEKETNELGSFPGASNPVLCYRNWCLDWHCTRGARNPTIFFQRISDLLIKEGLDLDNVCRVIIEIYPLAEQGVRTHNGMLYVPGCIARMRDLVEAVWILLLGENRKDPMVEAAWKLFLAGRD